MSDKILIVDDDHEIRDVLRVLLTMALSVRWGYLGIWSAWPIGWCAGAALSVWFYRRNFSCFTKRSKV